MMNPNDLIRLHETMQRMIGERNSPLQKGILGLEAWWKEMAGGWCLAPRQVGKTTALRKLAMYLSSQSVQEEPNVLTVFRNQLLAGVRREMGDWPGLVLGPPEGETTGTSWMYAMRPAQQHLLLDEFMYLHPHQLEHLLKNDWLSVTGVSSLK